MLRQNDINKYEGVKVKLRAILNLILGEVCGQLHAPAILSRGPCPRYQLRPSGPRHGFDNVSLPAAGSSCGKSRRFFYAFYRVARH